MISGCTSVVHLCPDMVRDPYNTLFFPMLRNRHRDPLPCSAANQGAPARPSRAPA